MSLCSWLQEEMNSLACYGFVIDLSFVISHNWPVHEVAVPEPYIMKLTTVAFSGFNVEWRYLINEKRNGLRCKAHFIMDIYIVIRTKNTIVILIYCCFPIWVFHKHTKSTSEWRGKWGLNFKVACFIELFDV